MIERQQRVGSLPAEQSVHRFGEVFMEKEICLGQLWALGKMLVLLSLSKEEYCKYSMHTSKQAPL